MQAAIAFHHKPEGRMVANELVLIVSVADAVAHSYLDSDSCTEEVSLCQPAWEMMGAKIKEIEQWLPDVRNGIQAGTELLLTG